MTPGICLSFLTCEIATVVIAPLHTRVLTQEAKYFKLAPLCYHSGEPKSLLSGRNLLVNQNLLIFSHGADSVIELMGRTADDFLFPEKLNIYCSLEPWDKCSVGGR